MRPFNVKLLGCIGLLVGIALVGTMGCGDSGDPIDEIGYRYQISMADPQDRNSPTNDIDIWQDCDNVYDPTNNGDGEDAITGTSVSLTFQSNTDQLDIWVYSIRTEFALLKYEGSPAATPNLPTNVAAVDIFIPGNKGSSSQDVDLLSPTDKEAYQRLVGQNDAGLNTMAVFQVTITAFLTYTPNDPQNHIEIRRHFLINVGNFQDDSCPATTP